MEKLLRFLSGEAPIGFLPFLSIVLALLFLYWFMDRYSPVVNRKKFRTLMFSFIGLLVFTFTVMRVSRPPRSDNVHIGFLPLRMTVQSPNDSVYLGLSWGLPEMTARAGESQAPEHVIFLRPEWLTAGYGSDSAGQAPFDEADTRLRWGRLTGMDYLVYGNAEIREQSIVVTVTAQAPFDEENGFTCSFDLPKTASAELIAALTAAANDLASRLLQQNDQAFHPDQSGLQLYATASAPDYFFGRYLLQERRYETARSRFQLALQKDSSSLLGWYGTGLSHGESMIVSRDDAQRTLHQKRMEYFLKMAAHKNSEFQPAYSALVRYFMLSKPEPRYLDAELAMVAANDLYPRDYQLFYNLSFMNKMRWESFKLNSRDAILKKALSINPAGFDAYLELGRYYIQNSRPHDHTSQLALDNYGMAHQLRPTDLDAILGLVTAYDFMSYYDKAVELLDQTIRRHPDQTELYYSLGVVHFHVAAVHGAKSRIKDQSQEQQKSETNFRKAVDLSNHGYAHLYLGKIYDMQKKRNEAIEEFRICMKILKKDDPYRDEARKQLREYFPDVE